MIHYHRHSRTTTLYTSLDGWERLLVDIIGQAAVDVCNRYEEASDERSSVGFWRATRWSDNAIDMAARVYQERGDDMC